MIGRTYGLYNLNKRFENWRLTTTDWTPPDWTWWDALPRSKQPGYELGALFAAPIAQILTDFTFGRGLSLAGGDDATTEALGELLDANLDLIITADYEGSKLGNAFLVINPDGSLTAVSPDLVTIEVDELDYRHIVAYVITSKPSENVTVTDRFEELPGGGIRRTITAKKGLTVLKPETFDLPIDELPVIHVAPNRGPNEIWGHPIYDALRVLFGSYDDVLTSMISGVKLMGTPVPVVEGSENPEQERTNNQTGTTEVLLSSGETLDVPIIDFSQNPMFFLGKGASFKFASPSPFTNDAVKTLEILFLLMLQHSRIPEWAWGGAISSSMASVQAQAPAFGRMIEGRQRKWTKILRDLARIWLKYRRLTTVMTNEAPVKVTWPDVMSRDETLLLQWAIAMSDRGILTKKTFLILSNTVEDPQAELDMAEQEAEAKRVEEERMVELQLEAMSKKPEVQGEAA